MLSARAELFCHGETSETQIGDCRATGFTAGSGTPAVQADGLDNDVRPLVQPRTFIGQMDHDKTSAGWDPLSHISLRVVPILVDWRYMDHQS